MSSHDFDLCACGHERDQHAAPENFCTWGWGGGDQGCPCPKFLSIVVLETHRAESEARELYRKALALADATPSRQLGYEGWRVGGEAIRQRYLYIEAIDATLRAERDAATTTEPTLKEDDQ